MTHAPLMSRKWTACPGAHLPLARDVIDALCASYSEQRAGVVTRPSYVMLECPDGPLLQQVRNTLRSEEIGHAVCWEALVLVLLLQLSLPLGMV